ncbi:probable chitinase 10 [Anopheles cruzii]|uniref:probable chitinase 10 n=1 Tax=Anopheles cruzii TaxID=68878 RepID=UPI0022EC4DFC|nr:probable chitinase 10 [Anopheles cruzii]
MDESERKKDTGALGEIVAVGLAESGVTANNTSPKCAIGLALVAGLLINAVSARFISDNICLAMPNGQKLPITEDCGAYIVCEYNVQKIQRCTAGTLFDPVAMVCNWATFVKCGQTPSLPPSFLPPSSPAIPTAPTPPPRIPSTVTPANPTFFPNIPTVPTAAPTAPAANPGQPPFVPTAPTARPTASSTSRPTTTLRTTMATPPPSNLNPYPYCTPDEFSFIAHPSACESYYICAYGNLILHSCGNGVYWNTATNQCDFPQNTDCTNLPNPAAPETSTPSIETTTVSSTPDCVGSEIFHPNYADCSKYFICIGLHPILMSCPSSYLWNSKISQCDLPASTECARKP